MVKVKSKKGSDILTFFCPGCGKEDICYIGTPRKCYTCGFKYDFLVHRLVTFLCERRYYHFKTKTK